MLNHKSLSTTAHEMRWARSSSVPRSGLFPCRWSREQVSASTVRHLPSSPLMKYRACADTFQNGLEWEMGGNGEWENGRAGVWCATDKSRRLTAQMRTLGASDANSTCQGVASNPLTTTTPSLCRFDSSEISESKARSVALATAEHSSSVRRVCPKPVPERSPRLPTNR